MKRKMMHLMSVLLLCVCVLFASVPAFASATNSNILEQSLEGYLPTADDVLTHTVVIDHSVNPDVVMYAYSHGATGDATILVTDENGNSVTGVRLLGKSYDSYGSTFVPKWYCTISDTSGATKTYTITATTSTGDAGYRINFGTEDTAADDFGGIENVTTVAKNIPAESVAAIGKSSHFRGCQALLGVDANKDGGEWFRYTADGYTYITASITNVDNLAFAIYEADTERLVYDTKPTDIVTMTHSTTLYESYVQYGVELDAGRDYLIQFYSNSAIAPDSLEDFYNIFIGLPSFNSQKISLKSTSTYTVPANTTKTYRFNVTAGGNTPTAGNQTKVSFSTSSVADNAYITSCIITAPNGYSFPALNGSYSSFDNPDVINYLTNPNNVPINGTWTVSIRTSKALSGLSFKISGYTRVIMGNYVESTGE